MFRPSADLSVNGRSCERVGLNFKENPNIVLPVIFRQYRGMQRNLVNLIEVGHVIELLDRYAPRDIVDRALQSEGLNRGMFLNAKGFLPYASEAIVVESVARSIGDRHLGARLGRDFDYGTYGAYASYVLGAPDLATALDRGRRALCLTHPGSTIVLRETDSHLVVGRDSRELSVIGHRHLDEGALFVIGHVARYFVGPDWRPDWVELPEADEGEAKALEELTGAPVRLGCAVPGIAIRRSDLAALNPGKARSDRDLSLEELGALMGVKPVQTMRESVGQIMDIMHPNVILSEEAAARFLAVGPRSLQRALKTEGVSFRKIRAEVLQRRARELLRETELPIEAIGARLGYAEPKSFRRAFKRWVGVSPMRYRSEGEFQENRESGE